MVLMHPVPWWWPETAPEPWAVGPFAVYSPESRTVGDARIAACATFYQDDEGLNLTWTDGDRVWSAKAEELQIEGDTVEVGDGHRLEPVTDAVIDAAGLRPLVDGYEGFPDWAAILDTMGSWEMTVEGGPERSAAWLEATLAPPTVLGEPEAGIRAPWVYPKQ